MDYFQVKSIIKILLSSMLFIYLISQPIAFANTPENEIEVNRVGKIAKIQKPDDVQPPTQVNHRTLVEKIESDSLNSKEQNLNIAKKKNNEYEQQNNDFLCDNNIIKSLAASTIFSDNFSGSYPGSWYIGHDGGSGNYAWAWPNDYAHCYSNPDGGQYYYPNNLNVYMERRNVNLSGYSKATLTFSKIVDTEGGFDIFTVNIRDQNGSWHEIYNESGESDLQWDQLSLNLDSFAGQTGLYIQFRFDSDGSVSGDPYEGVFIDNISLIADVGCNTDSYEPNNSSGQAVSRNLEFSLYAYICPSGDEDWFKVPIDNFGTYEINLSSLPGDYDLYFYDPNLNLLDESTNGGTSSEQIQYSNFTMSGFYYIQVIGHSSNYHPSDSYYLSTNWTTQLPDLIGNSFDSAEPLVAGQSYNVAFGISNNGSTTYNTFYVDFYLSSNSSITTSDYRLKRYTWSGGIDGNYAEGRTTTIDLPPKGNAAYLNGDGNYYIGIIIDANNDVTESNENNNSNMGDGIDRDPVYISSTQNSAPSVSLTSPPDEEQTYDTTPTFYWSSSDVDGDLITNNLYISTSNDPFQYPMSGYPINVGQDHDMNWNYTLPSIQALNTGNYTWGIRADDGLSHKDSEIRRLEVIGVGTILIDVKDQNSNYTSGVDVIRYDNDWEEIDTKTTNSSGRATWTNVEAGLNYHFSAYNPSAVVQFQYGENWGSVTNVSVSSGATVPRTINRVMPFAYNIRIQDINGNQRTTFTLGETVKILIDVDNNDNSPHDVKVQCQSDRDQTGSMDYDHTSSYNSIPGSSTGWIEFNYIPINSGNYFVRPRQTFTYTIGDQLTDSWEWPNNAYYTVVAANTPPEVTLNDPQNGAQTHDSTPAFYWTSTDADDEMISNYLYIATDSNDPFQWPMLGYPINIGDALDKNWNYSLESTMSLAPGNYTWGIKVDDNTDQTNSAVRSLTILGPANPAGNAIWIDANKITGNGEQVLNQFLSHDIKTIFLNAEFYSISDFENKIDFTNLAHNSTYQMSVHALVYGSSAADNPTSAIVQNRIDIVRNFNNLHPESYLDGVQVNIEGKDSDFLFNLINDLNVPANLIFSAAVQINNYDKYTELARDTDLDLLIPMLYIMDAQGAYTNGQPSFSNYDMISNNTSVTLQEVGNNADADVLIGLSSYDRELIVPKAFSGNIWNDLEGVGGQRIDNLALDPNNTYSIPSLIQNGKTLISVDYISDAGVSWYRFEWDASKYIDVIETTPLGLRQSDIVADQVGNDNSQYLGSAIWVYDYTFDGTSQREDGLVAADEIHPTPIVEITNLDLDNGTGSFSVNFSNQAPSETILGDDWGSGVFLEIDGDATFNNLSNGEFNQHYSYDATGNPVDLNGSKIIELTKWFFEPGDNNIQSGDITLNYTGGFKIRYRGWMKEKDEGIQNPYNNNAVEPYVARFPDDENYDRHSYDSNFSFMDYATLSTGELNTTILIVQDLVKNPDNPAEMIDFEDILKTEGLVYATCTYNEINNGVYSLVNIECVVVTNSSLQHIQQSLIQDKNLLIYEDSDNVITLPGGNYNYDPSSKTFSFPATPSPNFDTQPLPILTDTDWNKVFQNAGITLGGEVVDYFVPGPGVVGTTLIAKDIVDGEVLWALNGIIGTVAGDVFLYSLPFCAATEWAAGGACYVTAAAGAVKAVTLMADIFRDTGIDHVKTNDNDLDIDVNAGSLTYPIDGVINCDIYYSYDNELGYPVIRSDAPAICRANFGFQIGAQDGFFTLDEYNLHNSGILTIPSNNLLLLDNIDSNQSLQKSNSSFAELTKYKVNKDSKISVDLHDNVLEYSGYGVHSFVFPEQTTDFRDEVTIKNNYLYSGGYSEEDFTIDNAGFLSTILDIWITPPSASDATINSPFSIVVNVGIEVGEPGVLQILVDGSTNDIIAHQLVDGYQSTVQTFNIDLLESTEGLKEYNIYVQYRPGAPDAPLETTELYDVVKVIWDYTINWHAGVEGILGDINDDQNANSTDALIILSCDAEINVSQFCPMDCGDVNDDGFINSTDALIILSYDASITVPFPIEESGCPTNVMPCPGCNP
ncbi:hypothetical protein JW960_09040 [candidate division KSB1 bacterium]|nr:hypothetical protein [candidate division KSB1 bacterium]